MVKQNPPKATHHARAFPTRFATSGARGPHPGELLAFEQPAGDSAMNLGEFFPASAIKDIQNHGSISFHAMGDSGVGTQEQHAVADAMSKDIDTAHHERGPAFLLHLGDIVYGPDKLAGYANKFYRPNGNYQNLVFAIPGNHDGEMRSAHDTSSLQAYFANFCQPKGKQPALGSTFGRAMVNQTGAYWRLSCPFVDIVGLYSNTGENYGSIAHAEFGNAQKVWLAATLSAIAADRKKSRRALIIAVHHPPYASGLKDQSFGHPGNPDMLKDIDDSCTSAALWPDAVLSAHAHNYQHYERTRTVKGATQKVPYLVAGGGGITPQSIPAPIGVAVGDARYVNAAEGNGYLTVTASSSQLSFLYTQTHLDHRGVFETFSVPLGK